MKIGNIRNQLREVIDYDECWDVRCKKCKCKASFWPLQVRIIKCPRCGNIDLENMKVLKKYKMKLIVGTTYPGRVK